MSRAAGARVALLLEYDGSDFAGWQRQPAEARTVQGTLEAGLGEIAGTPIPVTGAGRTDAGVHALGQVASLPAPRLAPRELRRALNGVLPRDLAVRAAVLAPHGFDARRDARGKRYRYRIWNARVRSPLRARFAHHEPRPLDLAAMRAAAAPLLGRRDFASFQAAGSAVETTVRCLGRLEIRGAAGAEIDLVVEGDGFLRHMVRNVAGTLIEVGLGRRTAGSLPELLAARDRSAAGPTAPARGLTLLRVHYAESLWDSEGLAPEPLDVPGGVG